jgi:hypothetical protein
MFYFFLRTVLTVRVFLSHSGFLDHIQLTYTVGLLWNSDQPVTEASTYTGQHNGLNDRAIEVRSSAKAKGFFL